MTGSLGVYGRPASSSENIIGTTYSQTWLLKRHMVTRSHLSSSIALHLQDICGAKTYHTIMMDNVLVLMHEMWLLLTRRMMVIAEAEDYQ